MNKRVVKIMAAGIGAALLLTACAVSGRQIVTGPSGLTVPVLDVAAEERQAQPTELRPAAEPAVISAPQQEKPPVTPPISSDLEQSKAPATESVKAAESAKTVESAKAVEQAAAGKMSSGCSHAYDSGYSYGGADD